MKEVIKEAGLDIQHYAADGNFKKKKTTIQGLPVLISWLVNSVTLRKEFLKYIKYTVRIS